MAPTQSRAIVLRIGKAYATAYENKMKPSQKSQHHAINLFVEKKGLKEKFDMLPEDSKFTFRSVGETRIKDDYTIPVKLFCGENNEHQTWALVKKYNHKPAELLFINEFRTGEIGMVDDFEQMALMYPFKVFKKTCNAYAMKLLETIALYIFLINGHCNTVFPKDFSKQKPFLSAAIGRICKEYESKGIENVPNMHLPSEDLSVVRGKKRLRSIAQHVHQAYNDDTKTIISESSRFAPHSAAMLPPPPPADAGLKDLESHFDTISVADLEAAPVSHKRSRGDDDDDEEYSEYIRLMRDRKHAIRDMNANKEKVTKLSVNNIILQAKVDSQSERIDALTARLSQEQMREWLRRHDMAGEE